MNSLTRPDARPFSAPDPTPILFVLGAALALLWAAEYGQASLVIAAIIVIPFLLFQFSRHRMLAATALIAATALGRFFLDISGLKAYPEHLAVGALALLVPFWIRRFSFRPTLIVADFLLLLYVASNLLSSTLDSPEPRQTFRWAVLQILVIAPYFLLRLVVEDRAALKKIFGVLLAVGTLEAAYTVICFFSGVMFGTTFGMEKEAYGAISAPYGTQREPNIVGSYCGATLIMLLVTYFARPSRKLLAAIAITAAAAAVSLSRAAVAATLVALIFAFVYGLKAEVVRKRTLLKAGLAILVAWMAVAPAIASLYHERLKTVSLANVTEDDTVGPRLLINVLALQDILDHPFFGTGTASFQVMVDLKDIGSEVEGGWIGNTELRIMHDTGSVGLAVFLSFVIFLIMGSKKVFKRESHPELAALLLSGIVYCIAFQATEGTLLAFSWVHFGLIGCALALFRSNTKEFSAGREPENQSSR